MTHIWNSNIYWYLGTFLTCVITTGIVTNFNFLAELDINLHDSYISVATWQLTGLIFTITAFLIFIILSIRSRFRNLGGIWILLLHNTLIIGTTLYILYVIYAVMTVDAFAELFRTNKSEQLMIEHLNEVLISFSFILLPFITAEILLIRRIRRLKKVIQADNSR